MKTTLFVPDKINVGFQNRSSTYTGKLAYVIYFDQKGVLRKEKSWEGWRDKKIDNVITENVPTSGFVLNKKAGDYSSGWDHRQAYARVYDPRGFEFEITIDNLLYILECCDMFKGKGIDGELVYAWSGKDLVLLPINSPDYKEIMEYNTIIKENKVIKGKDLKLGHTYLTKNGEEWVYLGKHHKYDYYKGKMKNKYFYFASKYRWGKEQEKFYLETVASLGQKFISEADTGVVDNYAELVELMESSTNFSPIDVNAYKYKPMDIDKFLDRVLNSSWKHYFHSPVVQLVTNTEQPWRNDPRVRVTKLMDHVQIPGGWRKEWVHVKNDNDELLYIVDNGHDRGYSYSSWDTYRHKEYFRGTLAEVFEWLQPSIRQVYLENGKLHEEEEG